MADVATDALVDGRYRILSRVGSGGMADVYCAEDVQLDRKVALKVLHRRFAEDPEFVERFRREASSAAGLQHPHVVNVFDRGEHDDTYYIAMEYLEGRTLKDLIVAEAPLSQERAIDLGMQILAAASFAHERGVVHRDFKPHNVIVDEHDNAKVTDFGIARAGASEMTETGSILGTAQYLSPEQAQGKGVGERSDIYSIGVMIFEMLAGRLPFEGDSAVAVAVMHLNQPPPRLASLRPDVHPGLEAAVMRALVKDPDQRWGSAAEFVTALQAARAAIAMGDDGQGTAIWGPLPPEVLERPEDQAEGRRRRRWPLLLLPLLLLTGAALAFLLTRGPGQVAVPDLVGEPLAEAVPALETAGFDVAVERQADIAPINEVLDQAPDAGLEADEGSVVTLTVSSGPPLRKVPDVVGETEEDAVKELNRAEFEVDTDRESSSEVSEGLVARTVPTAGTRRRTGSRILVFVSSGARQVEVPNVVGSSRAAAAAQLRGEGLTVSVQKTESDEPEDQVIAQDPSAGTTVQDGASVTISVSSGGGGGGGGGQPKPDLAPKQQEEQTRVPDVTGASRSAAVARLRAAGFSVGTSFESVDSEDQDDVVLSQSPSGGSRVDPRSSVTIVVGRFEPPPDDPGGDGPGGGGGPGGGSGSGGSGGARSGGR